MREDEFLKVLEKRVGENAKLAGGGLPKALAPFTEVLGMKTPEVLVFVSFGVAALWFLVDPLGMLSFVRRVLLMR